MRIPVAMYGIQFNPSFDFQAAREITPHIAELGMKDYIIIILRDIMDTSYKELLATREDGRIKLFRVNRALQARNEMAEVFHNGSYIPIEAGGRFKVMSEEE